MNKGVLLIVSGPSGAGKGTICSEYMKRRPETFLSISATSRAPRPGDEDGVTYFFKTKAQFEQMIEQGELFEYAEFCGNFYGTPKSPVMSAIESGRDVILEIEVQGALQVKEKLPEAVLVFVLPPSPEVLKERLTGRGTESAEAVSKRIGEAEREISNLPKYDYIIVNDSLSEATDLLESISDAEKARVANNKDYLKNIWNLKE